ncbi:vitamin B12 ABC transporter ATP-binding protein BtuD [Brenneria goodwinii]|uniref:Vitamin B12 import ATP-binding protein BtuD n=1 Tax=Brenneria goodwinii TaxID=1109412 RepID=A0A0G4JZ66_9GAMM|nr:vitamin B12 ABC transporter ATP-binding protein BtuD [Brenneria goodwinii]ATA23632.1 vitamin B12 ABC transporter ATP-binding protein [Brenneria goodwinii]MCG8154728.1 vitamin B12 ABC transporter ATP-binding protein BtuD [Brenneria goodwinii]MCG8159935.1 vitamin B12 ABC transporter ATP-binding protein BtuD [Brenneria goodwinii]MCG8163966.1 vitamin B12 ABC transporter ATP-binding protein BtuD [Brenneria goodwinii]MCG8168575.1 vitamin B12 ABC transporter ATP-binding protein BtuD [Brenneria goo
MLQSSPLLQLRQAGVFPRLSPVNVECRAGQLLHIIGPNGAGKSTLLSRIAGMLSGEGDVYLSGRPLSAWPARELARHRAYLAQQQPPVAMMPVFQYLRLHQPATASESIIEDVVSFLAERLMLTDKLARSLTQLSGGEWQRVRLAATLLQIWPTANPHGRLLLLDEPANSLDIAQQVALDDLFSSLCQSGLTVIVCAHDLNHSLQHANGIWLMSGGRLVAQGDTDEVMQPETLSPVFGVDFQRCMVDGRHWVITRRA